ncbi:MAG TPA: NAD(P)-dependent oxidoreductase [Acidobacteriaceae bacterium]|jgi:nucleoside-diphosphate-sugar epimerase
MRYLVTGSSGHLGEALVRTLRDAGHSVTSIDILPSPFTTHTGSINHRTLVQSCMKNIDVVFHAATLHKPHVATHSRQQFIDTNLTGTLTLLECATSAGVRSFIYTSTTSVFGDALIPPPSSPAAWITEETTPVPKNIYGVTKAAAEDLCRLFHRNQGLPVVVLRTSRFFPEEDDTHYLRVAFSDRNLKANEYLHRRVDLEDVVTAHLLAAPLAPAIGFQKYIISATTPFLPDDLTVLRTDAPAAVFNRVPAYEALYRGLGWKMFPTLDRVYVNQRARTELSWQPRRDFQFVVDSLNNGVDFRSELAQSVGSKGYHAETFTQGPYPVDGPSR